MTVGSNIFVDSNHRAADSGNQAQVQNSDLILLTHELTHVVQCQQDGGIFNFLTGYAVDSKINGRYQDMITEKIAFEVQGVMANFLNANPAIQAKLLANQPLSQADLALASEAIANAQKNGSLQTGYRFVDGYLIYVWTPPAK